jgi:hypothetical protein
VPEQACGFGQGDARGAEERAAEQEGQTADPDRVRDATDPPGDASALRESRQRDEPDAVADEFGEQDGPGRERHVP